MSAASTPRFSTAIKATAFVAFAIVLLIVLRVMVRPTIDPSNRTIVVMPFENLGNATDAYFADGLSEEIANQLALLPGVKVIGRDGVRGVTVASLRPRELAATVGAQYVLSGTVKWDHTSGDSVDGNARVQVEPVLLEASVGERVWSQSFEERLRDVFRVQENIALRVADALSVKLNAVQRATFERIDKTAPAARDAQLRARVLLRQRGLVNLREARTLFTQAVTIDSTYARAWAGLAESVYMMSAYGDTIHTAAANLSEAMSAAQRAMTLDSAAVDVRLAYARILSGQFRLVDAMRALDGVIASDSTSLFAWILKAEMLEGLGQQAEAGVAYRQALALDRLAPVVHATRSTWFLNSRMNDSAITSAERAVALAPGEARWMQNLVLAYVAGGRVDDAIRVCSAHLPADTCTTLLRGMGGDAAARAAALASVKRLPAGFLTLSDRAVMMAQLGDAKGAFDALQRAITQHDSNVIHNISNPNFDALHDDPRWGAIVRAIRGDPAGTAK